MPKPSSTKTKGISLFIIRISLSYSGRITRRRHGVFEKNRSAEELLDAIRIVSAGNTHATTEWASIIDSNYQALGVDLSPRQQEVLELIASGETDRAIAEMLNIRQSTVNDYVNRIRTKFAQAGCETEGRGELIKQGMYSGILPGPSDPRN